MIATLRAMYPSMAYTNVEYRLRSRIQKRMESERKTAEATE